MTAQMQAPTRAAVLVCHVTDLLEGRGVAALVHGEQVALFRVGEEVFAVQQRDPYSGAHVLSRGIVGTRGDRVTVASPMFKQVFDLRSGACLETLGKPARDLQVWPVMLGADGGVHVGVRP